MSIPISQSPVPCSWASAWQGLLQGLRQGPREGALRRLLPGLGACLLGPLLGACAPEGPVQSPGVARLSPASDAVDFGKVFEGAPLRHRFELEVLGSGPVQIERVHTTCGCTAAELFQLGADGVERSYELDAELWPGDRLIVEVEYDTLGRPGSQERTLALYGEIPEGRAQLTVAAQVQPLVASQPPLVDWGQLLQGEVRRGELLLTSVTGAPLGLRVVEAGVPAGFSLALAPVEPGPDGRAVSWRLEVESGPGLLVGGGRWHLPLEAVLPGARADGGELVAPVRATVQAQVMPIVQALPRLLEFGVLDLGATVEREVALTIHKPGFELPSEPTFEIELRDTAGNPAPLQPFEARLEAKEGESRIVIWTDGMPEGLSGAFRGRIAMKLDSEAQPVLPIGFNVVATGR